MEAQLPGPTLNRSLSLLQLSLYGIGTTIGAGIYVLLGKVAGLAGAWAPLSFLGAAVVAGLSAASFAELAVRHPRSAGEAAYVRAGFGSDALALLVGLLVILTGAISCAAITVGATGYVRELVELDGTLAFGLLVFALAAVAAWGIVQSVSLAALMTLIEVGGLLVVIVVVAFALPSESFRTLPQGTAPAPGLLDLGIWSGIAGGAFLAFFAFIGFEDMVNVVEEVREPQRAMPLAIATTLAVTATLYLLLAGVAVLTLTPSELAASDAPLALLYGVATGGSGRPIAVIGVVATLNGALVQIVMASRVLYGLGAQGSLPAVLARVHPLTRTPLIATGVVAGVVLLLGVLFPIENLARMTAAVTLTIFTLVNAALIALKCRRTEARAGLQVPTAIPVLGAAASGGLLAVELVRLVA